MSKKRSTKFWLIFWTLSAVFLSGWFAFWEFKNQGIKTLIPIMDLIPFFSGEGEDYKNAAKIADYVLREDNVERTYLVLFQNNLELRPGGGFMGSFGIIKLKNGKVVSMEILDPANFDNGIPEGVEPPYPMGELLKIKSWKMRDSNFSPDFEINAKKAEEFYYMGQGKEKFDGIIGTTTNVFSSILKVVGPIKLKDYPGTYDSENAVITLEYQVEKAYEEQGIDRAERKSVMSELAEEIENRVSTLDNNGKLELGKEIINSLNKREILLYFKDATVQDVVASAKWGGKVDSSWKKDYLMLVDANLGSFKSDYYMNRSVEYTIDLSGEKPVANLKITYLHTAKQKDWMTKDYASYLRVYVPEGAWMTGAKNFDNPKFGNEFGKKYFGSIINVPVGTEKVFEISYELPKNSVEGLYDLMVQKQTGILDIPYRIYVIEKDGRKLERNFRLNSDIILSEL